MENISKRTRFTLVAAALLLAALMMLGGCAQGSPEQDEPAQGAPIEQADVQQACDAVRQSFVDASVLNVDAQVDESTKTVYLTLETLSQDVPEACASAEAACRQLSAAAVNAMLDRLSDEGDADARQRYEALASDADDRADGLGVLYETYALSLRVDNEQGTLDVDGVREAGPEGSVNWQ